MAPAARLDTARPNDARGAVTDLIIRHITMREGMAAKAQRRQEEIFGFVHRGNLAALLRSAS